MGAQHTPGPVEWQVIESPTDTEMYAVRGAYLVADNLPIEDAMLISGAREMHAALVAAKQEMWLSARASWNMADFKNWAIVQQIDAALEKADGKQRVSA